MVSMGVSLATLAVWRANAPIGNIRWGAPTWWACCLVGLTCCNIGHFFHGQLLQRVHADTGQPPLAPLLGDTTGEQRCGIPLADYTAADLFSAVANEEANALCEAKSECPIGWAPSPAHADWHKCYRAPPVLTDHPGCAEVCLSEASQARYPQSDIEGALRKAQDAKVAAATIDQARTEFETIKQTVARELLHRLEKDAAVDIAAITELVAQGQRVGIQSAVLDLARERCANAERTSHAILQLLSHPPVLHSKLKGLVEQAREYRLPNDSGSPRFAAETKLEAMGVVLTELELAMKSFAQQDDDRNRQRLLAVLLEVESMQLQPANLMQVERVAWRVLCTRLEPVKPEFIAVEDAREVATIYEAVLRINLSHLRQLLGAAELRASPAATTLDTAVKDAYQKGKPFALPSLQNLATALQAAKRAHVEIESKMGLEVLLRPQLVAQLQKLQAADDYHTTTKYVKELTSLLMSLTSNGVLASRRMPARACQRRWCWGTRARAAAPVLPLPARVRRALP